MKFCTVVCNLIWNNNAFIFFPCFHAPMHISMHFYMLNISNYFPLIISVMMLVWTAVVINLNFSHLPKSIFQVYAGSFVKIHSLLTTSSSPSKFSRNLFWFQVGPTISSHDSNSFREVDISQMVKILPWTPSCHGGVPNLAFW